MPRVRVDAGGRLRRDAGVTRVGVSDPRADEDLVRPVLVIEGTSAVGDVLLLVLVVYVVASLLDLGIADLSIGDTIGVAVPADIRHWL